MLVPDLYFQVEMSNANSDPDATARAYLGIAKKWRDEKTLTPYVIEFIICAFEKSMILPQKEQGPALLRALKLTYGSRRPLKVSFFEIGVAFEDLIALGKTRGDVVLELVSVFKISESSVNRALKAYRKYEAEMSRINAEIWADQLEQD
jgi:hypothetical protein